MISQDQQNNQQDDGFQSINTNKHDLIPDTQLIDNPCKNNKQENKQFDDNQFHALPPGQSIISMGRKYSLFPDIATGWMPRNNKCTPIPITVSDPMLDSLFEHILHHNNTSGKHSFHEKVPHSKILKRQQNYSNISNRPNQMIVCYFGPRYDNTFYAWHQMPFQFPYTHIQPPNDMKFTNRPFIGQHPTLNHLQPNTLIFNSFFQNGNLDCVIKVGEFQYDLYLRVDSNTRGHFQWYNFSVKNFSKGLRYKFNICNMQKDNSLYMRGMKPYMLSQKAKQKIDKTWIQDGENIKYEKRPSKSMSILNGPFGQAINGVKCKIVKYYNLSFQYTASYDQDTVHMAYCIPYTFTDLNNYLNVKRKKCENKKYYSEGRLCMSLGGLPVPIITINQEGVNGGDQQNRSNQMNLNLQNQNGVILNQAINPAGSASVNKCKKKCIVIGCRVHPGQSNSSFMLQGFIDFILSNKPQAKSLRSKIIFKIVPMLNPDGVCFGNYRTGLSGKDFNREYTNPDSRLFPEVYSFKKMILDQKKKYGNNLLMFLDFHGHSVRKNVFMYGPQNSIMDKYYYQSRIFPRILSKKTDMFRYYSCVFKIEQDKKTTARSIFQKMHNIPLSYTIQASNGSYYDTEILKDFPFTQKMWTQMGNQIGASLSQYVTILVMAEKAKQEKYKKLSKYGGNKQQSNLRTSKLMERKKQKKKGGQKIEDFSYGRVMSFKDEEEYDQQLFKYIYEQIEQSETLKKNAINKEQINRAFQLEDKIMEGGSDRESEDNDLQPQKLQYLHQIIKRKQYNENNLKNLNKSQIPNTARSDKQSNDQRSNSGFRTRSAMGNNQQQYFKRLSQPKKKGQNIVNLFLEGNYYDSNEPMKILGVKSSKVDDFNKRNPKTFQDFVASYQKWFKSQKEVARPASAINGSYTITQGNTGSTSHQLNKNWQSRERKKQESKKTLRISHTKIQKTINSEKQYEMYKKVKIFSPVKSKNISIS